VFKIHQEELKRILNEMRRNSRTMDVNAILIELKNNIGENEKI